MVFPILDWEDEIFGGGWVVSPVHPAATKSPKNNIYRSSVYGGSEPILPIAAT